MPKEKTMRTGRRAASKEALKQMHNIFLGEKRKVTEPPTRDDVQVLSDDDDVVEVSVQPPVKKYKVSNKKSTTGSSLDVIVLKSLPCAETLEMDFAVEELSAAQVRQRDQLRKEEALIQEKLDALVKDKSAQVVYTGVCTTALEVSEHIKSIMANVQAPIVLQPSAASTQSVPSYQLVMDPRSGVIVGAVTATNASQPAAPTPPLVYAAKPPPKAPVVKRRGAILRQVPSSSISPLHKAALQQSKNMKKIVQTTKALPPPPVLKRNVVAAAMTPVQPLPPVVPRGRPLSAISRTRLDLNAPHVANELTATGGVGKAIAAPASTKEDDTRALSDSREVSFNKLQGRTYPSLVVIARPHLRVKDLTSDRTKLDLTVKGVLLHQATKFTEWLIQQGLVRSEQKCSNHYSRMLKLGMYSDASKFPYSGGYVWISECCPNRFVSVFSGSLFEGSAHPPIAILKLLYHWCCQTIVQNVTQWVNVDLAAIDAIYARLRSVCSFAIRTHFPPMAGEIEMGIFYLLSLRIEILAIMDVSTHQMRFYAVHASNKHFILQQVKKWLRPRASIHIDASIDLADLQAMGFAHVHQAPLSNGTLMTYMREHVAPMFNDCTLPVGAIQQFLDELAWREWYGSTVNACFENLVKHLAEQTEKVLHVPRMGQLPAMKAPVKLVNVNRGAVLLNKRISVKVQKMMVPLESYYYGSITPIMRNARNKFSVKCSHCNLSFTNNIKLMKHVLTHLYKCLLPKQLVCQFCLTIVDDKQKLQEHVADTHPVTTKWKDMFVCLICEIKFSNRSALMLHMSAQHKPAELPYACGSCTFRCSWRTEISKHFYEQHKGEAVVQCPFCLKSVACDQRMNVRFYIKHLKKHVFSQRPRKCFKCCLSFVEREVCNEHMERMHVSMQGHRDLVPMPTPPHGSIHVAKTDDIDVQKYVVRFDGDRKHRCKECGQELLTHARYLSAKSCSNLYCKYSTCCRTALTEHTAKCRFLAPIPDQKLPFRMFCACGYKGNKGNAMAKHLFICKKKTAYKI